MEPGNIKKTSSCSSSGSWLNDLRNVPHKDIAKLTIFAKKKVEKAGRKLFNNDHHTATNTFVPSNILPHETSVAVPPPYPEGNFFGCGFPPLPTTSANNSNPPSYGWALNSDNNSSQPSSSALSLDIGIGDETAGSGLDYITNENMMNQDEMSYLKPINSELARKIEEQKRAYLNAKKRVEDEHIQLDILMNDDKHLSDFLNQMYPENGSLDIEAIRGKIIELNEKLEKARIKDSGRTPPPRPPPPRSTSQDSTTSNWKCSKCDAENVNNHYRCRKCDLPSRRIDPIESTNCKCENCS
ncbi:unnamed protein product [Caenorhabditis angaria]|uniref:RanBP2-type domain-containing protein n=1 Tax=Caenorhabditis angaria TaxID=860376 RepID=A0A9P1I6G3_9PELO|nr:unnamed protein product [Caenorhabditis angaria]